MYISRERLIRELENKKSLWLPISLSVIVGSILLTSCFILLTRKKSRKHRSKR
jgi:hypothetical protein